MAKVWWYGDLSEHYCPVCGSPIIKENEDPDMCEHVLFVYLDLISDFIYLDEKLQKTAEEAMDSAEEEGLDNPIEKLAKRIDKESVLCYEIGTGFADSGSTVYICIDYNPNPD